MISNEEMYEFASLIAGISDSDLQQYKCGGKTKKVKKAMLGQIAPIVKKKPSDSNGSTSKIKKGYEYAKNKIQTMRSKLDSDMQAAKSKKELQKEKQNHPERFDSRGNRKYNKKDDLPTNEDWRPGK